MGLAPRRTPLGVPKALAHPAPNPAGARVASLARDDLVAALKSPDDSSHREGTLCVGDVGSVPPRVRRRPYPAPRCGAAGSSVEPGRAHRSTGRDPNSGRSPTSTRCSARSTGTPSKGRASAHKGSPSPSAPQGLTSLATAITTTSAARVVSKIRLRAGKADSVSRCRDRRRVVHRGPGVLAMVPIRPRSPRGVHRVRLHQASSHRAAGRAPGPRTQPPR